MNFLTRIETECSRLAESGLKRGLKSIEICGLAASFEGRELLNLSSNDYLGLSARNDLAAGFLRDFSSSRAGRGFPLSAASSRLLTGNHPEYGELESELGRLYGGRAALAANSGYHANIGLIPALAGEGDLILSDELNHASLIDGIRLSRAERSVYPHLDLSSAEKLLAEAAGKYRTVFIVTESVFSMDGDTVDMGRLVELKSKYGAVLVVDEAHAVGVFGRRGLGLAEESGVIGEVDIIVGTFGKALCSAGAFLITEPVVREYLVSAMRPLLFTTGLAPVNVAWSLYALGLSATMEAERRNLTLLSERLREGLKARGFATAGRSQIVPLILGASEKAIASAERLRGKGFLVFPIRPPTVPVGTARLRISLNAGLGEAEIDRLLAALED